MPEPRLKKTLYMTQIKWGITQLRDTADFIDESEPTIA